MKSIKLIYVIGRYPELTTTFIEHEIEILSQLDGIEVQPVSLRYPLTPAAIAPEHEKIRENTLYLVPKSWLNFHLWTFFIANLFFIFRRPSIYFKTIAYLFVHEHPNLKTRLLTLFHFGLGVYLAYLLRRQDFDHLHAHFIDRSAVVTLVVGKLLNKSYSLTAHANSIFVKQILIREKIINAKFMVTVSEHNKAHFLNTYPGLHKDKIHILHPWVNMAQFTPLPTRPLHKRLHILSVGRLVEKKGHIYLIEACRILKERSINFECRLVGEGALKQELEARINRYGLQDQVQLVGGQPLHQVKALLKEWADVFVLPCVIAKDGDRDGIPVALAEAMAMELPVISTDTVGIGELVKPGTGILVPPHQPEALAAALQTIHTSDPSTRAEMGRRGRAVVDAEFNLIEGTTQLANIFRQRIAEDFDVEEISCPVLQ